MHHIQENTFVVSCPLELKVLLRNLFYTLLEYALTIKLFYCVEAPYTYYKSLAKEHKAKSSGNYDDTVVTKRRRERFNRVCTLFVYIGVAIYTQPITLELPHLC